MKRPEQPTLAIIRRHIHREMARHAAIVGQWASWIAYNQNKLEEEEARHERLCAGHRHEIRLQLVETFGKSGLTERAVADQLLSSVVTVRRSAQKIRKLQEEIRLSKAIYAGLDTKTHMLQSYVGLRRSELENLQDAGDTE